MTKSRIGGIVLAAGLSSRMKQFKPLMEIDGRSMIGRVIDGMRQAGAETIVVVTGHKRELLEAHLENAGVICAYNPDYAHTQQLESLRIGLRALSGHADRILVSPADVPLVAPQTILDLLALSGDFVRPMFQGEAGHPVILDASLMPMLMAYGGPGGLRGAVESSGCVLTELNVSDRGTVLDNDTPEDFKRILQFSSQRGSGDPSLQPRNEPPGGAPSSPS
ncbi:MAG: NTP transferase domain-containing protein [Candidatus Ventricola sp.]